MTRGVFVVFVVLALAAPGLLAGPRAQATHAEVVDQALEQEPDMFVLLSGSTWGQYLVVGQQGELMGVDVRVAFSAGVVGPLILEVLAAPSGGHPRTSIATATHPGTGIGGDNGDWISFRFTTPAPVWNGLRCAITLRSAGHGYRWAGVSTSGYPSGETHLISGSTGQPWPSDLLFRTHVLPRDVTAPESWVATTPTTLSNGWATRSVTVSLDATDHDGHGLGWLTYSAAGAHSIPVTSTTMLPVSFQLWRAGETTITHYARDSSGNVEATKTLVVGIDLAGPTVTTPTVDIAPARLSSAGASVAIPLELTWEGSDPAPGSGIAKYLVQRSTNGGATWTTVATVFEPRATVYTAQNVTARYRVRAQDAAGRWSNWSVGSEPVTPRLVQETPSASVVYSGTWTQSASGSHSGGAARYTAVTGRSVTFSVTGRELALVAPKSTNYGIAKVYVDGVLIEQVDLYAASLQARGIVFRHDTGTSGAHTLRIEVTEQQNPASTWKHVFVDAVIVLS